MKKTIKILILFGIGLSFTSCYYDTYTEASVPEVVSYKDNIQPLWNSDCVRCHPVPYQPDLSADNSYESLLQGGYVIPGNAEESRLYLSLFEGTGVSLMPPKPDGPWPDYNRQLVKDWIDQGALDN